MNNILNVGLGKMIYIPVVLWVLFCLLRRKPSKKNLPPAAWNTPIIGCLSVVRSKNIAEELSKVGEKLGPVVKTHLGFQKLIILNGPQVIKEAFLNSSLSGRPNNLHKQCLGGKGLTWSDEIKETRKFISKCFKHFEFSGGATESTIHEEITLLLQYFKSNAYQNIQIKTVFSIPTLNSVFKLLLGIKIPHDDQEFRQLVTTHDRVIALPGPIMRACVICPILTKWLPSFLSGKKKIKGFYKDGLSLVQRHFDSSLVGRVPNEPRNFADALKDIIDETSDPSSTFHCDWKSEAPILFDLLIGAIDTTGATLEWLILYLSHFPAVQKKLQAEIDRILNNHRFPSLSDRPIMPFTLAVIHEIFRLSPILPYSARRATEDTTIMGYLVEKDSYIIGNYYGIHRDPNLWENPEDFYPDRFLDKYGNFVKPEMLFTFGYGKRNCVGEVTARDQMFLFVTRIFQEFTIVPEKTFTDLSGHMSFANHCVEFKAKFIPRMADN